jgi:hypothetical protein
MQMGWEEVEVSFWKFPPQEAECKSQRIPQPFSTQPVSSQQHAFDYHWGNLPGCDLFLPARVGASGQKTYHLAAVCRNPGMFGLILEVIAVECIQEQPPVFQVGFNRVSKESGIGRDAVQVLAVLRLVGADG